MDKEKLVIARFEDTASGGVRKLEQAHTIYMEVKRGKSREAFKEFFGIDPKNIYCDCCGVDFHITEFDSLEGATIRDRRRATIPNEQTPTAEQYLATKGIAFVSQKEQTQKRNKLIVAKLNKEANKSLEIPL